MRNDENFFANETAINKLLERARTDDRIKRDMDRATQMKPMMDAIAEKCCDWTPIHLDKCFKYILKKYADPKHLALLLATSGLDESYINLKDAASRRTEYGKRNPERDDVVAPNTLLKRENTALKAVAQKLCKEYKANNLYHIITGSLSLQELKSLGLEKLAHSNENQIDAPIAIVQSYLRNGRITNIGHVDDRFVGRSSLIKAIETGFVEGYKTQLIGGAGGRGKTRLALEYAHIHEEDYKIICWINAHNQGHIISSILRFFDLAEVPYDSTEADTVRDGFLSFFSVNTDWLIVFDNAELTISLQKENIKRYIPSGKGHIIVTGNFGEAVCSDIPDARYYSIDNFNDTGDREDSNSFAQNALSTAHLDESAKKLVALCDGEPLALTLVFLFIRQSSWVNCDIYCHLLEDRNIYAQTSKVSNVAFEIMLNHVRTKQRYTHNMEYIAIEQALILFVIFAQHIIDLDFLCSVFQILPDSIRSVCVDENSRERFIKELQNFGIIEIRHGVLISNSFLTGISEYFFYAWDKTGICTMILDKAEKALSSICNNSYIRHTDAVLAQAKPYINSAFQFMVLYGENVSHQDLKSKYPRSYQLSYYKEWD